MIHCAVVISWVRPQRLGALALRRRGRLAHEGECCRTGAPESRAHVAWTRVRAVRLMHCAIVVSPVRPPRRGSLALLRRGRLAYEGAYCSVLVSCPCSLGPSPRREAYARAITIYRVRPPRSEALALRRCGRLVHDDVWLAMSGHAPLVAESVSQG
jgi:hypothetical protein